MFSWLLSKYLPAYQCSMEYGAGSPVADGGGALPLLCSLHAVYMYTVHRMCSDECLNRWLDECALFAVRETLVLREPVRCRFG